MPVTGLTAFHGPFNPHKLLTGCFPGISTWVFHRNQQINMLTMEPITFFPKLPPSPPQWLQPEIWESSWTPLSLCPYLTFNQIWSPKSESNPLSTAFTCLQPPPLWSISGLSLQPVRAGCAALLVPPPDSAGKRTENADCHSFP